MTTGLKALSLFSNCGAGDVGYRRAGFNFQVMAELLPHRLDVCLLNHPGAVGVVGDLRQTWEIVVQKYREKAGDEAPALLCACPPCQGMSSARSGKGRHDDIVAGSRDERNLLVTVIAKVANELLPSVIVVENVPAFLTRRVAHPDDGLPTSAANFLIASLEHAYDVHPIVANLADFGVPQSRTRSFLTFIRRNQIGAVDLLSAGRAPFPRPTHAEDYGAKQVTIAEALAAAGLPSLDAATSERAKAPSYSGFHDVPVWSERQYAMVAAIPAGSGRSAWENNVCSKCGVVSGVEPDSVLCPQCSSPLLRPITQDASGSPRLIRGFKTSYRRMRPDRPAATVTTASGHVGSDNAIHPTENRLLSILECAALQTFPTDFKWGDALSKFGASNVRAMVGEAVPPAFTEMHGKILAGLLDGTPRLAPISATDLRVLRARDKLATAAEKDAKLRAAAAQSAAI